MSDPADNRAIESKLGLSEPGARDARGRFAPGNTGGPGRPRRAIESDYLMALSDAMPLEKWREICETAIDQAVAGDPKAREWLGEYLIGKPNGNALRRIAVDELADIDPLAESVRMAGMLGRIGLSRLSLGIRGSMMTIWTMRTRITTAPNVYQPAVETGDVSGHGVSAESGHPIS